MVAFAYVSIFFLFYKLAVYIYYGATYNEWLSYSPALIDSPLIFYPPWRHEAWRFFTYMFLHAG